MSSCSEDGEIQERKKPRLDGHSDEEDRTVLPVANFDSVFTPESLPKTGEQYLALVRHQRKNLPDVYEATELESEALTLDDLIGEFTVGFEPLRVKQSVIDCVVEDYMAKREQLGDETKELSNLPCWSDRHAWLKKLFNLDHKEPRLEDLRIDYELVKDFGHDEAIRLISFHVQWLSELDREFVSVKLIWELLLRIDLYLTPTQYACLRDIAKSLLFEWPDKDLIARDIVIVIAKCFRQSDLVQVISQ